MPQGRAVLASGRRRSAFNSPNVPPPHSGPCLTRCAAAAVRFVRCRVRAPASLCAVWDDLVATILVNPLLTSRTLNSVSRGGPVHSLCQTAEAPSGGSGEESRGSKQGQEEGEKLSFRAWFASSYTDFASAAKTAHGHVDGHDVCRTAWLAAQTPKTLTAAQRAARAESMEKQVRTVIAAQDAQGRWITRGKLETRGMTFGDRVETRTFIDHIGVLSAYLSLLRK